MSLGSSDMNIVTLFLPYDPTPSASHVGSGEEIALLDSHLCARSVHSFTSSDRYGDRDKPMLQIIDRRSGKNPFSQILGAPIQERQNLSQV